MKDYFKPKTWLITILMFMVALGFSSAVVYYDFGLEKNIKITRASADDNVSGWAWNSNIGWISFNCDHTTDGTSPPTNTCGTSEYGVKIDLATGYFSGYAWSSNMGWISFNRSDTGDPPDQPYKNGSIIAKYTFSNKEVDGWAKILSLGDNGWIKLRKFASDSGPNYGVSIDPATSEFSGWAWNANSDGSGIGWISFNCANDGSCGSSNYKTIGKINRPPTVTNMTAPNWSFAQAGQYGTLKAILGWTFSDLDTESGESAYQIIVNDQNNTNSPLFDSGVCIDFIIDGKCSVDPGVGSFPLHLALANNDTSYKSLEYDKAYYWWVKVWNNHGVSSLDFEQYDVNPDTPLEANDGANNKTFTTYKHEMPEVDFTWFPLEPSKGEEVQFTDQSKVYSVQPNMNPVDCTDDLCDWAWSAPGASITGDTTATPIITFNSTSNQTVTLEVTDQDGYIISHSETINVNANLPGWKEVKPE